MKRKPHSTSLVLLLVCIFTFWWGVSVLAQRDLNGTEIVTSQTSSLNSSTPLIVSESISGTTHTYSGTFMPPACDSFGSGIHYSAQDGGHVSVLLITEPSTTNCAQAAGASTGEPFSVSIKLGAGSSPAFDGVLLNGAPIPAQLVGSN